MFQKKLSYNLTPMIMKKLIFLIFIFLSLNVFSQIPNLSEFISDLDKKEGYLNFYWDDNKGKIYLEIKNLNQELIYINYLSERKR